MKKRILFGTTNQTKQGRFQKLFESLDLEVLTLRDLDIDINVTEDRKTPEGNAIKKARTYFSEAQIPTFAIDYGLYIDRFPEEKQPGLFVRRIYGTSQEATDVEMLEYYMSELNRVGGESEGSWISAIALVVAFDKVFSRSFSNKTIFTSKKSAILTPGEPLNSLQIDPALGKYKAEMTPGERMTAQDVIDRGFLDFMRQHIRDV
ncbi:MAG: hypothetical protein IH876_05825 [Gemmatimonadetes bacterium]|nr:hypothetical protein [Gemmatimonadota bacterium]